jgi:hypothetical protein
VPAVWGLGMPIPLVLLWSRYLSLESDPVGLVAFAGLLKLPLLLPAPRSITSISVIPARSFKPPRFNGVTPLVPPLL